MGRCFPYLLELARVDFELTNKSFVHGDALNAGKHGHAGHGDGINIWPEGNEGRFRLIDEGKRVVETGREQKRMHARVPFVVIAYEQIRLLDFLCAYCSVRHRWTVKLSEIASFGFIMLRLEINGILGRDLLFEGERELALFEIVISALTRVRVIKCFEVVVERPVRAILAPGFSPGAAAQVFGARNHSKTVAFEEPRIFAL